MDENEVSSKYKETALTFSSYYKYSFSFAGVADDGAQIYASFGGCSDEIYRCSVSNNETRKLGDLSDWNYVSIKKDEIQILDYSE